MSSYSNKRRKRKEPSPVRSTDEDDATPGDRQQRKVAKTVQSHDGPPKQEPWQPSKKLPNDLLQPAMNSSAFFSSRSDFFHFGSDQANSSKEGSTQAQPFKFDFSLLPKTTDGKKPSASSMGAPHAFTAPSRARPTNNVENVSFTVRTDASAVPSQDSFASQPTATFATPPCTPSYSFLPKGSDQKSSVPKKSDLNFDSTSLPNASDGKPAAATAGVHRDFNTPTPSAGPTNKVDAVSTFPATTKSVPVKFEMDALTPPPVSCLPQACDRKSSLPQVNGNHRKSPLPTKTDSPSDLKSAPSFTRTIYKTSATATKPDSSRQVSDASSTVLVLSRHPCPPPPEGLLLAVKPDPTKTNDSEYSILHMIATQNTYGKTKMVTEARRAELKKGVKARLTRVCSSKLKDDNGDDKFFMEQGNDEDLFHVPPIQKTSRTCSNAVKVPPFTLSGIQDVATKLAQFHLRFYWKYGKKPSLKKLINFVTQNSYINAQLLMSCPDFIIMTNDILQDEVFVSKQAVQVNLEKRDKEHNKKRASEANFGGVTTCSPNVDARNVTASHSDDMMEFALSLAQNQREDNAAHLRTIVTMQERFLSDSKEMQDKFFNESNQQRSDIKEMQDKFFSESRQLRSDTKDMLQLAQQGSPGVVATNQAASLAAVSPSQSRGTYTGFRQSSFDIPGTPARNNGGTGGSGVSALPSFAGNPIQKTSTGLEQSSSASLRCNAFGAAPNNTATRVNAGTNFDGSNSTIGLGKSSTNPGSSGFGFGIAPGSGSGGVSGVGAASFIENTSRSTGTGFVQISFSNPGSNPFGVARGTGGASGDSVQPTNATENPAGSTGTGPFSGHSMFSSPGGFPTFGPPLQNNACPSAASLSTPRAQSSASGDRPFGVVGSLNNPVQPMRLRSSSHQDSSEIRQSSNNEGSGASGLFGSGSTPGWSTGTNSGSSSSSSNNHALFASLASSTPFATTEGNTTSSWFSSGAAETRDNQNIVMQSSVGIFSAPSNEECDTKMEDSSGSGRSTPSL